MLRRTALLLIVASVAGASLATRAEAGTVSVDQLGTITFQASPGEVNAITYGSPQANVFELSDAGAPMAPGKGCESDGSLVRCAGSLLVVNAGDQDDSVLRRPDSRAVSATVDGEDGNDTLEGSAHGGPGNDSLRPLEHSDIADGGDGDDVISSRVAAHVVGGPGSDRLVSYQCDDCFFQRTLDGGDGDDELIGSPSPEELMGGAGNDVISGGGTNDRSLIESLSGGPGNDALNVGGVQRIDPPEFGTPTGLNPGTYPFVGSAYGGPGDDRLEGGPNRDFLEGDDGNDDIAGNDGHDTLDGGAGDDTLRGGEGNDGLNGGPGADLIDGGPGKSDGITYEYEHGPVSIDLTRAGGDGPRGENDNILPSVEQFRLTDHDDRFVAARPAVDVEGRFGHDVLIGRAGSDRLLGEAASSEAPPDARFGVDRLEGRGGNDTLDGGPGSDRLDGGPGHDNIDGGRPISYYGQTATRHPSDDVITGGPGNDHVTHGWRVKAGPGDDQIDLADFSLKNQSGVIALGRDDNARCGPGNDFVRADYYDGVGLDCETLTEGAVSWRSLRPDARGVVTLTARCAWAFRAPCRGSVRIVRTPVQTVEAPYEYLFPTTPPFTPAGCRQSATTRVLGADQVQIRAGRVDRVTLRLSRGARHLLGRAGCLVVRAGFRFRDPKHRALEATRTFALRRPRS